MARTRTGTASIVKAARYICRLVGVFGAGDLAARTSTEFRTAVLALVAACNALALLDDKPLEIDRQEPYGPEDIIPI